MTNKPFLFSTKNGKIQTWITGSQGSIDVFLTDDTMPVEPCLVFRVGTCWVRRPRLNPRSFSTLQFKVLGKQLRTWHSKIVWCQSTQIEDKKQLFCNNFPQTLHLFPISMFCPTDGAARIFLPPFAAAGIRTHNGKVAPSPEAFIKDALPTELLQLRQN